MKLVRINWCVTAVVVLIASCCFTFTYGQSGSSSGYLVTNSSDTIYGNLDFAWPLKRGNIKLLSETSSKTFAKKDVKTFYDNKEGLFVKKRVIIDFSSNKTAELLRVGENKVDTLEIFLRVLVKSEASLYFYQSSNKSHYFIETPETQGPQELLDQKRAFTEDDDEKVIRSRSYIGLLNYYLRSCPQVQNKINSLIDLGYKRLMNIVEQYNTCTNNPIEYKEKRNGSKLVFDFGIIAGVTSDKLTLPSGHLDRGSIQWIPDYVDFPSYTSFLVGLQLRVRTVRNAKVQTLIEVTYSQYDLEVSYDDERSLLDNVDLEISYQQLQISPLIEYRFNPQKNIHPFLQFGVFNRLISGFESTKTTQRSLNLDPDIRDPFEGFSKSSEFGFIAGGGVHFGKLAFSVRYQRGQGIFTSITGSNTQSLSARVVYTLF